MEIEIFVEVQSDKLPVGVLFGVTPEGAQRRNNVAAALTGAVPNGWDAELGREDDDYLFFDLTTSVTVSEDAEAGGVSFALDSAEHTIGQALEGSGWRVSGVDHAEV